MVKRSSSDKVPNDEIMVDADDSVISRALVGSLIVIGVVIAIVTVGYFIFRGDGDEQKQINAAPPKPPKPRDFEEVELPKVTFTDVTLESGIDFEHYNGAQGRKLLPETMGGGVAFFDYDNDRDLDLLFVNSSAWPDDDSPATPATSKLFANDGTGTFSDVSAESGLAVEMYGMGVAIGDFDNDGWRDVFLTGVGHNRLLRNREGVFEDVTESAGVAGNQDDWSTSCGFLDFDNDGDLDLFVCNYVQWSPEIDLRLGATLDGVSRAYGPPTEFEGSFAYLYQNEGDGTFRDVSAAMGIEVKNRDTDVPVAKSLGVIFTDVNSDGWTDIIVANDTVENMLFFNQSGSHFDEQGLVMGIGVDSSGRARGAMGIDASNLRNDESLGIAIGNFANEPLSLYVLPDPDSSFSDEERSSGIGPQTRLELTFGVFFFDYDLDGRVDVFTANGHLENEIQKVQPSMRYEQAPHLLWNAGPTSRTEFVTVSDDVIGKDLTEPMVGRGAAFADIDQDGDLDVVIAACGQTPRLLRNDAEERGNYLRVAIEGPNGCADGLGATVHLEAGDLILRGECRPTRSYLSQCEPIVTFGLAKQTQVDRLTVTWPDGKTAVLEQLDVNDVITVAYPD